MRSKESKKIRKEPSPVPTSTASFSAEVGPSGQNPLKLKHTSQEVQLMEHLRRASSPGSDLKSSRANKRRKARQQRRSRDGHCGVTRESCCARACLSVSARRQTPRVAAAVQIARSAPRRGAQKSCAHAKTRARERCVLDFLNVVHVKRCEGGWESLKSAAGRSVAPPPQDKACETLCLLT